MKFQDYDAFIFDLDGTLIDSGKYHSRAFADAVFEYSGHVLTPAELLEFFGMHSTWFAGILNERYGLSLDPEQILAFKRNRVKEIFVAEPFSGARDFLEHWKGKKPLALASNSPLSFVEPALYEADLIDFFDVIITSDEVTQRKPHPEIIEIAAKKLNVSTSKILVFEDQIVGIEAAQAAGANVVAVDNNQPMNNPIDIVVHSWAELLNLSEIF